MNIISSNIELHKLLTLLTLMLQAQQCLPSKRKTGLCLNKSYQNGITQYYFI